MYYSPPKRSIWGHSLRKMRPAPQRERIDAFLSQAVAAYVYSTGSVALVPNPSSALDQGTFERHFTDLLDLRSAQPGLSGLSESQFETCYRELVGNPSLCEPGKHGVLLAAFYTISSWKIGESVVATGSMLGVYYGAKPLVMPRFGFDTLEEFDFLRVALDEAGLCKLNPKHIKGRRGHES